MGAITAADVGTVLATLAVGVLAGMLSALLGIGGAVVTTPAVRVLGATPIQAVGSTVPAILPGAISGAWRYSRAGLVDWPLALGLGISGAVFALAGAWTSSLVDGRLLMVMTAVLMLWSGISVFRGADRQEVVAAAAQDRHEALVGTGRADPVADGTGSRWLIGVVGAGSGFVAGLLGVGGGIVMVPAMAGPLGIPMKRAVASSLVAVAIFSIPALIAHVALGHVNWTYALPLMLGVVPGAQIGARMTIGASERTIRRLFGALVVVLAVVYGGTELAALLS
ncbi:MAG: sulfite exporter TauE/SafE family protein [Microthrixaceae bacterium]